MTDPAAPIESTPAPAPVATTTKTSPWRAIATSQQGVVLRHENVVSIALSEEEACVHLLGALARLPRAAIVGGRRVQRDGTISSMGEFIVHPKGFHHQGRGAAGDAYRFVEEADAITSGMIAVSKSLLEEVGGFEALGGGLGAVELGLYVRAKHERVALIPEVTIVEEPWTPQPTPEEEQAFRARWGFDWLAADLDEARARHPASGLLWNTRLHGAAPGFGKYAERPGLHWDNYANVEPYRLRADHLVGLISQLLPAGRVLDLGCGDGLFCHLLAQKGLEVVGIDPEAEAIQQAGLQLAAHAPAGGKMPGPAPRLALGSGEQIAMPDACVHMVIMLDVIEHLMNPARVLREVHRVIAPGGGLLISTPEWQYGASSDPVYHLFEYTAEELARQVVRMGFTVKHTGRIGGIYRDLLLVAQREEVAG